MTEKSKKLCEGCDDNYYNHNREEGCWCYDTAKVVKRKMVSVDDIPPWDHEPIEVLSCFNVKRYVMIKPEIRR